MSGNMYRLAIIIVEGQRVAVVEREDRLVPLYRLVVGTEPLNDLGPLLEDWPAWQAKIEAGIAAHPELFDASGIDAKSATFALPFERPANLICIGANYHDHVAEMPVPMTPTYPYGFLKPVRNTVRATGEPVLAPRHVNMMDWEAEMGAVIGRAGKNVSIDDALGLVAGYVNFNDLSARDWIA